LEAIVKQLSRSYILFLLVIIFAMTGCAGLSAQDEAVTQPVADVADNPLIQPSNSESPNLASSDSYPAPAGETAVDTPAPNAAPAAVQVPDALYAQQDAFISIYEHANPAVVHIAVNGGQGSGFIIDQQGHIVTNNHVVEGAGFIVVSFADGRTEEARLIGRDADSDLAVIQVDVPASQLTALALADSDHLQVGQIVIAIGNPFGLSGTMTTGIISSLDRELDGGIAPGGGIYRIPDIIQTDAAINPGNSGGPLLDLEGHVVGVNSAIRSSSNSSSGIGFAVPANIVQAVVPQIIANGTVSHPWLGIAGGTLTEDIAGQLGLSSDARGVLVSTVAAGGPAANAGLQGSDPANGRGDIIVSINDQPVNKFDDLLGYIVQHTVVGQTVNVQVLRNGEVLTVPLTLGARPSGQ
jgi:2-alkenal reductase